MTERTNSGKELKKQWRIPALQVRYHKEGKWFMPLEEFPGALADENGYVLFATQLAYQSCSQLRTGTRVNVTRGISNIPRYVRVRR